MEGCILLLGAHNRRADAMQSRAGSSSPKSSSLCTSIQRHTPGPSPPFPEYGKSGGTATWEGAAKDMSFLLQP